MVNTKTDRKGSMLGKKWAKEDFVFFCNKRGGLCMGGGECIKVGALRWWGDEHVSHYF